MKIVLAYSGGLDTSVIVKWLKEKYDAEIVTFAADVGQEEELDGLTEKDAHVRSLAGLETIDPEVLEAGIGGPGLGSVESYPLWPVDSAAAKDGGVILHTSVTIGYDAPWRKVHGLLIAAAGRTEGVLAEPKPFVLQTALNDFYVSYELNVYTEHPNEMPRIYSDLHQHIQDAFNEAGVEIMSPHYGALRDGNRIAIPDAYVPKTYQAPGWRFPFGGPKSPAPAPPES